MTRAKWYLGNPPKMDDNLIYLGHRMPIWGSDDDMTLKEYKQGDDNYLKNIIYILPDIWQIPFLGYYLWIKVEYDYHRFDYDEKYEITILSLDESKLACWHIFRETQFYRDIPKDIRGEILSYIYDDMLAGRNMAIYKFDGDNGNDIYPSDKLQNMRNFHSREKFIQLDRKQLGEWCNIRKEERGLIPTTIPKHTETEPFYPLL